MILQALVKAYDGLRKQHKVDEDGWCKAKVADRIILNGEGHFLGLISAREMQKRGKKEVEVPAVLSVPLQVKRTVGIKANFLCDGPGYFLGIDGKGNSKRARECFEAAKILHHTVLDGCTSPAAKAILYFFDHWDSTSAAQHPYLKDYAAHIEKAGNLIFQVEGEDSIQDEEIHEAWDRHMQEEDSDSSALVGQCLITGKQNQKIALLHPNLKGVLGAQSSGASLVSFNAPAFCSYGYDGEQGANAPVSKRAAFAYGTALNYFLADRRYAKVFGDTTVVYWSEHVKGACQDIFLSAIGGDDAGIEDHTLREVMDHVQQGLKVDLGDVEIDPDEPFYILGLAPNAARVSVRFFLRNTFGQVIRNIASHQKRMAIIRPDWEKETIPLWRTLKATVNPHSKDSAASPLLAGSLLRAVFQNNTYPEAVYQNILLRIFAENDEKTEQGKIISYKVGYVRSAFIKAYLLKNSKDRWEGQIQMAVNEQCNEAAYVLGRLFSVLENIQQKASPGINATIKDRYFNSACATPASVFPILLKLSNAHLGKLENSYQVYFGRKLEALLAKITMPDQGSPIPNRLTLEEQGAFILGYYQETQSRYTKKEEQ